MKKTPSKSRAVAPRDKGPQPQLAAFILRVRAKRQLAAAGQRARQRAFGAHAGGGGIVIEHTEKRQQVGTIGAALDAEKLILCTGAPGILENVEDPRTVVSFTDLKGLDAMRKSGAIKDGMLPKAKAIEHAIHGGVRRVHVISYDAPDSILAEVFTNEGTGTMIVADVNALSAAEQQAGKA